MEEVWWRSHARDAVAAAEGVLFYVCRLVLQLLAIDEEFNKLHLEEEALSSPSQQHDTPEALTPSAPELPAGYSPQRSHGSPQARTSMNDAVGPAEQQEQEMKLEQNSRRLNRSAIQVG